MHLHAREYLPSLGRLLSADTVPPNAEAGVGYNLYTYVANYPTRWADSSGHIVSSDPIKAAQAPIVSEIWKTKFNSYDSL